MHQNEKKPVIGVVATSSPFFRLVKEVSKKNDIDVIMRVGSLYQGLAQARELVEEHKVDVIISRGETGRLIERLLDIPTVVVEITSFDLTKAYYKAKTKGEKILFIDALRDKYYYEMDVVEEIVDTRIERKTFNEFSEIDSILVEAKEQGVAVIVATAECVVDMAQRMGLIGILINATEKDILEALNSAITSLHYLIKEDEKNLWFKTIFDNLDEGIITVEDTGIVRIFNRYAAEIFGIQPEDIIGSNVNSIQVFNQDLLFFFNEHTEYVGKIVKFRDHQIVLSRIPLFINSEYIGMFIKIQKTIKIQELEGKVRRKLYSKGFVAKATFKDIIGDSQTMLDLKRNATEFSKYDTTVLIQGESGTGKELFAQSIHNESKKKNQSFIAVNCASLPESLLESELFGYDDGAFTGAKKGGKMGLFELAHGGTIFLDEIGEISLGLQATLLRVIQEKEIMRIGSDRIIPIDTRIICATNRNLWEKVQKKEFREDLYYRINTLMVNIPPLRARKEDIVSIAKYLIGKKEIQLNSKAHINPQLLEKLTTYAWYGNVRELEGFIERFIILTAHLEPEDAAVRVKLFDKLLRETSHGEAGEELVQKEPEAAANGSQILVEQGNMMEIERQIVKAYLHKFNGNKNKVGEALGISKTTMWRKYGDL